VRARLGLLATIVLGALALGAAPAHADHHLVKIAEVSAGASGFTTSEYVQLQMTSSGQNFFGGTSSTVTLYDADGNVEHTESVDMDVDNGQRGRRVLIGASNLPTTPDFSWTPSDHLALSGGAACFTSGEFGPIDCVSWGSYDGSPAPPSPTGGNAPAIQDGLGIVRLTPPCGPGLIDTNDPSDLAIGGLNPANNASPAATGDPCPETTITKHPKKKTTKRKAVFEFTANLGIDTFKCKLDSAPFKSCTSPFSKRVRKGKHTFKVKATGDDSPASFSWKVVKRR
jgi:hypothetical protein